MSFVNNTQDDKKKKPWVVPEKSKAMKSTVKSDDATLASGKALYAKHCKSCHGVKGLGDGPKSKELETSCGDLSVDLKDQTDGEVFFKVKEGRDDMPSFKKKLPEDDDIWTIVNYIRTLADDAKKK
ncbi:MAG: cytochrome c [Bacteroidetes bacterium]|nr:cytochrome c [Bacteroidota bacterium]